MLAVQLPGRGTRLREAPVENLHTLAATLLPLLASRLSDGVPYAVVSHSMGAWAAYELLEAAKKRGLPMPVRMVVGAMPAPDIPMLHRPWRQQRRLGEEEFKVSWCSRGRLKFFVSAVMLLCALQVGVSCQVSKLQPASYCSSTACNIVHQTAGF